MPTVLEESQCWGGPAAAFAYIDGVVVLPAVAVLLVIFLLGLTLLGLFLGLVGSWLLSFLHIALFLTDRRSNFGSLLIRISILYITPNILVSSCEADTVMFL